MKNLLVKRFHFYKELADKTLNQLDEDQLFWQANPECNSVATIIHHISGNMISRWTNFLTEDGEKSWRNRDLEFKNEKVSKDEIIEIWEKGWKILFDALEEVNDDNLNAIVLIRGEKHSVIDALLRQLAHYSYHIGQMVYAAKILKNGEWETLSIARDQSQSYNSKTFKENNFKELNPNSSPVCFAKSSEVRADYKTE